MSKSKETLKKILLVFILILLVLPFFQSWFNIFEIKPLGGDIPPPKPNPTFYFKEWFDANYQKEKEEYLNESFGFRNDFIRLNNQIGYSFFKKAYAKGVIVGKENYLFEETYINAYYGDDFIGQDSVKNRMHQLKYVSDELGKRGKTLLLVFAAGKASFYPEYIPNRYRKERGVTNYETHLYLAKELGIKHIDFNAHFVANKETAEYPLYPKYGIHWSQYGVSLASDSLIRYVEFDRGMYLPKLYWNEVEMDEPQGEDFDIGRWMNLIFQPKSYAMAYPEIKFENYERKDVLSVLTISDSYFWGMYNIPITRAFGSVDFWFYNKQVYPASFTSEVFVEELYFPREVENHDLFIIMATEATLPNLGWGFIEEMYLYLSGQKEYVEIPIWENRAAILRKMENVRKDEEWMKHIAEKAETNNITLDSMLYIDAQYLLMQEAEGSIQEKLPTAVERKMNEIRSDEKWFKHIVEKAKNLGISVDSMLYIDAQYVLDMENQ